MGAARRLRVNGRTHEVAVDYADTPLLYVLRNDLGLKGTRFGCGEGSCGACTVLVEGVAQRSCQLPVWSVEEKAITTIEGLGSAEHPHPVQRAILDFQAAQCGYCLSGIMITASELFAKGEFLSREQIAAGLSKHLCRCGAHTRILDAIGAALSKAPGNAPGSSTGGGERR